MSFDLGFLGGGQLARMSIQAAQRMGLKCLSLDPGENTPASEIAASIVGDLNDPGKIAMVFQQCDRVTLENEFIPAGAIEHALGFTNFPLDALVPSIATLSTIQDKFTQRLAFHEAGVPAPRAALLEGDGSEAVKLIGFPMVLKKCFGGYDGKGTRYAKDEAEFYALQDQWMGQNWLAEEFVPFKRELATMVYLSEWGAGCFPTMETVQTNHVCDLVFPADTDASNIALAAVEAVGGRGLFGVEMFELENGDILVNEIAPRPHNTGHYSLDWGSVSQFEQHVRLAMGLPLAKPENYRPVCMANLLGVSEPFELKTGLQAALMDPSVRVHWYGKTEMRKGRKMGHLNIVGKDGEPIDHLVNRAVEARDKFWAQ